jgi:alpha-1,3-glucan synthase
LSQTGVQDFTGIGQGNQSVWLIYTNENTTIDHTFNCSSSNLGLISPFPYTTAVKNLFYPYEEYNLTASTQKLGFEGSDEFNGCINKLSLKAWEYKALVPLDKFVQPSPVVTRVLPAHDSRMLSEASLESDDTVPIEIHYSVNMSCDAITESLTINSTTQYGQVARLNTSSVVCLAVEADEMILPGGIPTAWIFKANLTNVSNGIHTFTINNATSEANITTNVSPQ